MIEQILRLLFDQQKRQQASPSSSCPGNDRIAQLIESQSPDEDLTPLKAHIADCPYCASRVADAFRSTTTRRDRTAPELRNIAIAAAVAVVAVTTFWLQPGSEVTPGDQAELRNVRQPEVVPELISPTEGQVVSSGNVTVRWTTVADAMHYSVRIVDDYGRIIVDSFADAPEYTVPSHLQLASGGSYYVKIDAYVVGDKAVSSRHTSFTVAD